MPTLSVRFEDLNVAVENTSRFLAAGGRVVYGTDLETRARDRASTREVVALSSAGMDVHDIIARLLPVRPTTSN